MATKTLASRKGNRFTIRRTDTKVRVYDYETAKAYTRCLWLDIAGQPYVRLNSTWRGLSQFVTRNGIPFTTTNHEEAR